MKIAVSPNNQYEGYYATIALLVMQLNIIIKLAIYYHQLYRISY